MIKITGEPVLPQKVLNNLRTENSGSLVLHVGVVRPFSEGKKVTSIEYQIIREDAERELSDLTSEIQSKWEIDDIAICRRAGQLNFGDIILIAAVSAARHKTAFEACQFAVEQMKNMKSVVKKEIFLEPLGESKEVGPHHQVSVLP